MVASTWAAFFTPGIDTEIWLLPDVDTSAPDTPSPLTRLLRMITASSSSDLGTLWAVWYTTASPPARSRPRRGDHLAEKTAAKDPSEIATTASTLKSSWRFWRFWARDEA